MQVIGSVDAVKFGPFWLARSERLLLRDGDQVEIGGRALDVLVVLTARAGSIVSQRELIEAVWQNVSVEESALRVQIASLRRALGDGRNGARYILTVRGRGYIFVTPIKCTRADQTEDWPTASINADNC